MDAARMKFWAQLFMDLCLPWRARDSFSSENHSGPVASTQAATEASNLRTEASNLRTETLTVSVLGSIIIQIPVVSFFFLLEKTTNKSDYCYTALMIKKKKKSCLKLVNQTRKQWRRKPSSINSFLWGFYTRHLLTCRDTKGWRSVRFSYNCSVTAVWLKSHLVSCKLLLIFFLFLTKLWRIFYFLHATLIISKKKEKKTSLPFLLTAAVNWRSRNMCCQKIRHEQVGQKQRSRRRSKRPWNTSTNRPWCQEEMRQYKTRREREEWKV